VLAGIAVPGMPLRRMYYAHLDRAKRTSAPVGLAVKLALSDRMYWIMTKLESARNGADLPAVDLRIELAAMKAVSAALEALPDVESRQRVLRWAADRFAILLAAASAVEATPSSSSSQGPIADADADLGVDGIDQLFGPKTDSTDKKRFANKFGR